MRNSHKGRARDLFAVARARWSLCKAGCRRDRRQPFPGQEFGRRDPPVPSYTSDVDFSLDTGQDHARLRPAMTIDLMSNRREL